MKQYFKMLEEEYNKPPNDVVIKLKKAMKKNKHHFISLSKRGEIIGGVTVFEIHKNIYCIHELIIDKEHRNKGAGKMLMRKVHNLFKGIFIAKTGTAKRFYEKIGYVAVKDNLLIYVNDDKVLNRDYWC